MSEGATEQDGAEVRVSMNWPAELREQVRELVGARGTTGFVVAAVRKELALRSAAAPPKPPAPVPEPEPDSAPAELRPDIQEPAEVVAEERHGEAGPDYRGKKVDVEAPPTLGVAARFSSSSTALADLKAKAAELGIRSASELPPPVAPREPEVPQPAYVAPEPPPVVAVEREPDPEPVPVPAAPRTHERNLDDFDVDF